MHKNAVCKSWLFLYFLLILSPCVKPSGLGLQILAFEGIVPASLGRCYELLELSVVVWTCAA